MRFCIPPGSSLRVGSATLLDVSLSACPMHSGPLLLTIGAGGRALITALVQAWVEGQPLTVTVTQ